MKPKNKKQKKRWMIVLSIILTASLVQHMIPAKTTYAATLQSAADNGAEASRKDTADQDQSQDASQGDTENQSQDTSQGDTGNQDTSWKGYATVNDLNMRKKASSSSKILKKFQKGDSMTVLSTKGSWYKVKSSGKTGYVYSKYVSSKKVAKVTGAKIANYAKKFVGNPYRYGGTSLTKGADCSGFTQSVYKKFGISIPRTSYSQRSAGKKVSSLSKAKAGDLICYYGHVAIYLGNNKIVHASSVKTGIKISTNARYRAIASIRRLV